MSADSSAFVPLARALRDFGVEYYICGSVASSMHGISRSTIDIDIVADIRREHVTDLVQKLESGFYIDGETIRSAIARGDSFNVIHLPTMCKTDVFIMKNGPLEREARHRVVVGRAFEDDESEYPIASAEDTILSKLKWYRDGGEVSERQWLDVIGVIQVQGENLDRDYLQKWSQELGVDDLLERARREGEL